MADLVGVWGAEASLGPHLRGRLMVGRSGESWKAEIAGVEAQGYRTEDWLVFLFPGGEGELRIGHKSGYDRLRAHWVQPRGITGGFSYATPVLLEPAGDNKWQAEVAPLDDRLELYLAIKHRDDESLAAFI